MIQEHKEKSTFFLFQRHPTWIVIRIVLFFSLWFIFYNFAFIPVYVFLLGICEAFPLTSVLLLWHPQELLAVLLAFAASGVLSLPLQTDIEIHVCTALSAFYLILIGFIIPLSTRNDIYLNWVFINIIFGTIIGWELRYSALRSSTENKKQQSALTIMPTHCPKCGTPVEGKDDRFCAACGFELRVTQPDSSLNTYFPGE